MPRYRYITNLTAKPDDCLDSFNLIANNRLGWHHAVIRVLIPDSLKLHKVYSRANWSMTMWAGKIRDYAPIPMIRVNGAWEQRPDLWPAMDLQTAVSVLQSKNYVLTKHHGLVDKNEYSKYLVQDADGNWDLA